MRVGCSAVVLALAVAPSFLTQRDDAWAELQEALEGRVSVIWEPQLKEKIKRWYLLLAVDALRWSIALAGVSSARRVSPRPN
jgi:hypothetical protein